MKATVTYRDVPVDVEFDVEPGQKEIIRADPNDSQEGISPSVEIQAIAVAGKDISGLFDDAMLEQLAGVVWKSQSAWQGPWA